MSYLPGIVFPITYLELGEMNKIGRQCTFVCPTCGNAYQCIFTGKPIKCQAEECTSELFDKMVAVIVKFGPQIRLVLDMRPDDDVDVEDMKRFCAEVFWVDIHIYQDRSTLLATLDRLSKLQLKEIPYDFDAIQFVAYQGQSQTTEQRYDM